MSQLPTLLIVDDDPFTRRSLARTLNSQEYRILQAENSDRGLSILASTEVNAVISDFHMGEGLDGAGFLAEVERRFPNVVRLLLTSDSATDVMIAAVNEGRARRVLYKPWHDDQIRTVVRQCLGLPKRPAAPGGVYTLEPMGPRTVNRLAALLGVDIAKE